jgi:hypothetical protein
MDRDKKKEEWKERIWFEAMVYIVIVQRFINCQKQRVRRSKGRESKVSRESLYKEQRRVKVGVF